MYCVSLFRVVCATQLGSSSASLATRCRPDLFGFDNVEVREQQDRFVGYRYPAGARADCPFASPGGTNIAN